jgi:hypothetical protein
MLYFGSNISTAAYNLKVGSIDSSSPYLYFLDPSSKNDDGNIIDSYYIPGSGIFGGVGCFKNLHFRAWGVGRLNLTVTGLDGASSVTPPFLTLTATPGKELDRQINFVNEKINVKFESSTTLNDYMVVDRLDIWGLQLWPIRPSV